MRRLVMEGEASARVEGDGVDRDGVDRDAARGMYHLSEFTTGLIFCCCLTDNLRNWWPGAEHPDRAIQHCRHIFPAGCLQSR